MSDIKGYIIEFASYIRTRRGLRAHQKVHPFEVSNVLNLMLDDRSMNLMHKQQEKLIKFVDFDKDMRCRKQVAKTLNKRCRRR